MNMRLHKSVRDNVDSIVVAVFLEEIKVSSIMLVIDKNRLPVITQCVYMMIYLLAK